MATSVVKKQLDNNSDPNAVREALRRMRAEANFIRSVAKRPSLLWKKARQWDAEFAYFLNQL